jgi:hypothetical protein
MQAARSGELHDFAPGVADTDLDPGRADAWPRERWLPAELLRKILLDPELTPDPRGLRLRAALVTGSLDLDHVTLPCSLALVRSHVANAATLRFAALPQLVLQDSHVAGLDLDGVQIGGEAA